MIRADKYYRRVKITDLTDSEQRVDEECVNPASLDLRIGGTIKKPRWYWYVPVLKWIAFYLDWPKWTEAIDYGDSFVLKPGQFVLCHSEEIINMPINTAGMLFSKSSSGRVGIEHLHAGFFDPGFPGQATFELVNVAPWPNRIERGQRIVQLVLAGMEENPENSYGITGRYNHQMGATEAIVDKV